MDSFPLVPHSNNSQVNWLIIIKSSRGVTRKINTTATASLPALSKTRWREDDVPQSLIILILSVDIMGYSKP